VVSYPSGMLAVMSEVPAVKLSRTRRRVLAVMAEQHGHRLTVSQIARQAVLSAATVRRALLDLERGKLVRHTMLPAHENHPARAGYWLSGAGIEVARSVSGRVRPGSLVPGRGGALESRSDA
jgi:hypothetical protein